MKKFSVEFGASGKKGKEYPKKKEQNLQRLRAHLANSNIYRGYCNTVPSPSAAIYMNLCFPWGICIKREDLFYFPAFLKRVMNFKLYILKSGKHPGPILRDTLKFSFIGTRGVLLIHILPKMWPFTSRHSKNLTP